MAFNHKKDIMSHQFSPMFPKVTGMKYIQDKLTPEKNNEWYTSGLL